MNAETGISLKRVGGMALSGLLVVAILLMAAASRRQEPETGVERAVDPASFAECQKRFAAMSNAELAELIARKKRLESLPESRQRYLRSLHEQWLEHPDREQLIQAMRGYTQWLMSLTDEERVYVKSGDIKQRLKAIAEVRQRKAEEIFGIAGETKLPGKDVTNLFEWSKEFVKNRQDEIRAILSSTEDPANASRSERFRGRNPSGESIFFAARRRRPEAVVELIRETDIADLKTRLSPEAVAIIDDQGDLPSRQKLIFRWVNAAFDALYNPEVSERDLREFFETELTVDERKDIESLAPDQRLRALRFLYRGRNMRRIAPNIFPSAGEGFRPPPGDKAGPPVVPEQPKSGSVEEKKS
jgi:hypothetical protein